jgi:hypothetical protein
VTAQGENAMPFDKLRAALTDYDVAKECWILQPGARKALLEKDKANKIHTILNIVRSACSANNVTFRLVGQP